MKNQKKQQKPIEDLTIEEKNVIITEAIFGLKVIFPQDYYANLKGASADAYRKNAPDSNAPVVVRNNKPLKTHSIDSYPMPNFYESSHRYELLARARARLQEMDLHLRFAYFVADFFEPPEFWQNLHWNLINAEPEIQADAIVKVLLENQK